MKVKKIKTWLLVEEEFVIGYFAVLNESPYRAIGCNFDELADKERAEIVNLEEDEINMLEAYNTKFVNGNIIWANDEQ